MDAMQRARDLVDATHASDPAHSPDGRPAELVYADRMESWVTRIDPTATPLLRLAARCQHLERWAVPRADFPMDRQGYNAWRRTLYRKQADRASDLLLEAGLSQDEAATVATWVSKTGLSTNAGTQALEDAACLVFLENEVESFAGQHEEYAEEKFVTILRRMWRKMSPVAHEYARRLDLSPAIARLLDAATAADAPS
jgi:hypothetical protein